MKQRDAGHAPQAAAGCFMNPSPAFRSTGNSPSGRHLTRASLLCRCKDIVAQAGAVVKRKLRRGGVGWLKPSQSHFVRQFSRRESQAEDIYADACLPLWGRCHMKVSPSYDGEGKRIRALLSYWEAAVLPGIRYVKSGFPLQIPLDGDHDASLLRRAAHFRQLHASQSPDTDDVPLAHLTVGLLAGSCVDLCLSCRNRVGGFPPRQGKPR